MSTCEHPLFGGIDLKSAKEIHQRAVSVPWARKNLFLVTITSPVSLVSQSLGSGSVDVFNLFCLTADYSPITLTGEKRRIGSAFADSLNAAEPIELRLTTRDDEDGVLKKWFSDLAALAAPSDGTVNPPSKYATKIAVQHAFIEGDKGWNDPYLYRPGALEISLSRAESALEELSLSFVQLDTFMPVTAMPFRG